MNNCSLPPIEAIPDIPAPPTTCKEPVVAEDEFIVPLPILVNPPNSFIATVCPAEAEIIGKPEISLTENISPEDLSAFFIAIDKNEDGLISYDEFMKASKDESTK